MTRAMDIRPLGPNLSVGGQIAAADLDTLAGLGVTDIVCNRPDNEVPGGPLSADLARRAEALGMGFHYLPIAPGGAMAEPARALARLTARSGAKVFAYCRSGARSSTAWALARDLAETAEPS